MRTISFEKLRAEFSDAGFILGGHHADCLEFQHAFSFEFNESTLPRAYEKLGKARNFLNKIGNDYWGGEGKKSVEKLSRLVTDSYCSLTVFASNGRTTCPRLEEPQAHDFLF